MMDSAVGGGPQYTLPDDPEFLAEDVLIKRRKILIDQKQLPDVGHIDERNAYEADLVSLLRPCLVTACRISTATSHRTVAIDTFSVILTRIVQSLKRYHKDGVDEQKRLILHGDIPETLGPDLVKLQLQYLDTAPPQLAKALRDCFSTFSTNYEIIVDKSSKELFAQGQAMMIIGTDDGESSGKVGFSLLEQFVRHGWVKASFFKRIPVMHWSDIELPSPLHCDLYLPTLLERITNRALAPSIGKFVGCMFGALLNEIRMLPPSHIPPKSVVRIWLSTFQDDIKDAMISGDSVVSHGIELYFLPAIFRESKEGFNTFLRNFLLTHDGAVREDALIAFIAALKVAKEMGFVEESEIDSYIPSSYSISELFVHPSGSLRLSVFHLLVTSKSKTAAFRLSTMKKLYVHLDDIFAESDAGFRNRVFSTSKVLIDRLVHSSYAASKMAEKQLKQHYNAKQEEEPSWQKIVDQTEAFVRWLVNRFLPSQVRLGSSYQRTILGLRVYDYLIQQPDTCSIHERNAKLGPVCFPFKLNITTPKLLRYLVERTMDPFEDIRSLAGHLLKGLSNKQDMPWPSVLDRAGYAMSSAGRAGEVDGVARLLDVMIDDAIRSSKCPVEIWGHDLTQNKHPALAVIRWALKILDTKIEDSFKDPNAGHAGKFVCGLFAGLQYMLQRKSFGLDMETEESLWLEVVNHIATACENIWDIVKPILCDDSPEGTTDPDEDDDLIFLDGGEDQEGLLKSQRNLSFSWRAVSDASNLLGTIATNAPGNCLNGDQFLSRTGNLLFTQLLQIRHRGSLSTLSPAFVAVCTASLQSKETAINSLPFDYLDQSFHSINYGATTVTRRSAGFPYAVSGILISVLTGGSAEMKSTIAATVFTKLFEIAEIAFEEQRAAPQVASEDGELTVLPQVHALNCVRHLFIDSKIAQAAEPFVGRGLRAATHCFSSDIWAIRNCGMMLFTALLNRIFGSGSTNNKSVTGQAYSSRVFVEKYLDKMDTLMDMLRIGLEGINQNDTKAIELAYPVLTLFSRFTDEGSTDAREMELNRDLSVLIHGYLDCKVWKIREVAAKAYCGLVGGSEDLKRRLAFMIDDCFADRAVRANLVHGSLCVVRAMLERFVFGKLVRNFDVENVLILELVEAFDFYIDFPNRNASPINLALYLRLVRDCVKQEIGFPQKRPELISLLKDYCTTENYYKILEQNDIGNSLLEQEFAQSIMLFDPMVGLELLGTAEVGITIMNLLASSELVKGFSDGTETALWDIVANHEWEQYKVAAMELLASKDSPDGLNMDYAITLTQTGPTMPLREAAVVYLGKGLQSLATASRKADSDTAYSIIPWLDHWNVIICNGSQDSEPFTMRQAILRSIRGFLPELKLQAQEPGSMIDRLLPTYLTLRRLLDDDDDEIRDEVAEIVSDLMSIKIEFSETGAHNSRRCIPLVANRGLTSLLGQIYHNASEHQNLDRNLASPQDTEKNNVAMQEYLSSLTFLLVGELIGVPLAIPQAVKQEIEKANSTNLLLFKLEKQNLYFDQVRNMKNLVGILSSLPSPATAPAKVSTEIENGQAGSVDVWAALLEYIRVGVDTLMSISQGMCEKESKDVSADGYLGWTTSNEDIFIIGMRIAHAFNLYVAWMPGFQDWKRKDESDIIKLVNQFVSHIEVDGVFINEDWLEAFRYSFAMMDRTLKAEDPWIIFEDDKP